MDRWHLPNSIEIDGKDIEIDADFRTIIDIFDTLTDPDLLDEEKLFLALNQFYLDDDYASNLDVAYKEFMNFINGGEESSESTRDESSDTRLFDWSQDFNIIVAPVNRILGYDCRGVDFLHWWTFLSAFYEIGECTFNTYVGIRSKLKKGQKLEKWEEKVYRDNKDKIVLKKKYDSTTQSIIDEILGKGV